MGFVVRLGGRGVELRPGRYRVGRVADNEIVLADATVSSHHAVLTVDPQWIVLQDLESTNGSFVNGARVTGSVVLSPGDRVMLGRFAVDWAFDVPPAAPPPPPPPPVPVAAEAEPRPCAVLAGRGTRLAAVVADAGLFWFPALVAGHLSMAGWLTAERALEGACGCTALVLVIQVVWLATRGQTIGKRCFGIRIVSYPDGTPTGLATNVVLRVVPLSLVAFLVCMALHEMLPRVLGMSPEGLELMSWYVAGVGVGLVDAGWIFLGSERRCLHDLVAGTMVVVGRAAARPALPVQPPPPSPMSARLVAGPQPVAGHPRSSVPGPTSNPGPSLPPVGAGGDVPAPGAARPSGPAAGGCQTPSGWLGFPIPRWLITALAVVLQIAFLAFLVAIFRDDPEPGRGRPPAAVGEASRPGSVGDRAATANPVAQVGGALPAAGDAWTEYVDPRGRFRCRIPPGWQAEAVAQDPRSRAEFTSGGNRISITTRDTSRHVQEESDRQEMVAVMEGNVKAIRAKGCTARLVACEWRTMEGGTALQTDLEASPPAPVWMRQVKYKRGGWDHLIGLYIADVTRRDGLLRLFEEFLGGYRSGTAGTEPAPAARVGDAGTPGQASAAAPAVTPPVTPAEEDSGLRCQGWTTVPAEGGQTYVVVAFAARHRLLVPNAARLRESDPLFGPLKPRPPSSDHVLLAEVGDFDLVLPDGQAFKPAAFVMQGPFGRTPVFFRGFRHVSPTPFGDTPGAEGAYALAWDGALVGHGHRTAGLRFRGGLVSPLPNRSPAVLPGALCGTPTTGLIGDGRQTPAIAQAGRIANGLSADAAAAAGWPAGSEVLAVVEVGCGRPFRPDPTPAPKPESSPRPKPPPTPAGDPEDGERAATATAATPVPPPFTPAANSPAGRPRRWTDTAGVKVTARLVRFDGQRVTLELGDGVRLTWPLTRLSTADRRFLSESAP